VGPIGGGDNASRNRTFESIPPLAAGITEGDLLELIEVSGSGCWIIVEAIVRDLSGLYDLSASSCRNSGRQRDYTRLPTHRQRAPRRFGRADY
jgi:hypothetical protein